MQPLSRATLAVLAAALAASAAEGAQQAASAAPRPNIILVALDDYGWADSWHAPPASNESQIPTLRSLVAEGIDLERHHVFMYCSPSRSALHTGRNPLHVNVLNNFLDIHNPSDPVSGYQGIPLNMTLLPQKLKEAGYATHFVGKSHLGMATPLHIPTSRGYDSSLHYFEGANDYWNSQGGAESECAGVSMRKKNKRIKPHCLLNLSNPLTHAILPMPRSSFRCRPSPTCGSRRAPQRA